MSSVQSAPPRLPQAPEEYSSSFMSDLIRALEIFISQERNPGELRASKIVLTALPTSGVGLEAGSLYVEGNTVKISLADYGVMDGASATGSVGSVTISTP